MTLFTMTPLVLCWRFPPDSKTSKGPPQIHTFTSACVQLVWSWTVLTLVMLHQRGLRSAHVFDCAWWWAVWNLPASRWSYVQRHNNLLLQVTKLGPEECYCRSSQPKSSDTVSMHSSILYRYMLLWFNPAGSQIPHSSLLTPPSEQDGGENIKKRWTSYVKIKTV